VNNVKTDLFSKLAIPLCHLQAAVLHTLFLLGEKGSTAPPMRHAGGTARVLENLQRKAQLAFFMNLFLVTKFAYVLK